MSDLVKVTMRITRANHKKVNSLKKLHKTKFRSKGSKDEVVRRAIDAYEPK